MHLRRFLALLLLTVLLLSGCAGAGDVLAPAIEFRAALVQAGGCSFTAEVTADDGEAVETFTLDCTVDETGAVHFEVVQPQTLAGITATVSADGGTITYDGMAMDFGLFANGNVIPAAAPALVVCCWRKKKGEPAGIFWAPWIRARPRHGWPTAKSSCALAAACGRRRQAKGSGG